AFAGGNATLRIDGTSMPANTIDGFAIGDTVDLAGVSFASLQSAHLGANNVLQITAGGTTYSLQFDPGQSFFGENFNLDPDGGSGLQIDLINHLSAVIAGQTVTNRVLTAGNLLQVLGSAVGTTMNGGEQDVVAGGVAINSIVNNGGVQFILNG